MKKRHQNTLNQHQKNQQIVSSQDTTKALIDVQELHKKGIITAEEYEGNSKQPRILRHDAPRRLKLDVSLVSP